MLVKDIGEKCISVKSFPYVGKIFTYEKSETLIRWGELCWSYQ